jgi:hypothetical protein
MDYAKSPGGTYHLVDTDTHTICGTSITTRWKYVEDVPDSPLAHTCRRCLKSLDADGDASIRHPYNKEERTAHKIREMQQASQDTPKIGE